MRIRGDKRSVLAAVVLAVLALQPVWAAAVRIVATVGEEVITSTDLTERVALVMAMNDIPASPANIQKVTPRVVQSLIDETLQLQEAKRSSITVSDEELAEAIKGIGVRGQNKSMQDLIRERGLSMRTLEQQIRAQLAWKKLVQRKLRRNVSISQDELERAQLAAANAPAEEEFRIQALEFPVGNAQAATSVEKQVEDVLIELKSGAEMAAIAAREMPQSGVRYSQPNWVPESQLPPALQQTLRGLKAGELTPPLRSGRAIQLLQMMERRGAPKLDDTTEYALKQITIAVPETRDKASLSTLRNVATSLRADPGDCLSEAVPETALPVQVNFVRTRVGALSPQQRSIVSHLEVGEVSEPLLGPDALRLVVMCEKIEPAGGALPDADKIRQQLFAEKLELEAEKHLRNLRRDASIDIKGASEE